MLISPTYLVTSSYLSADTGEDLTRELDQKSPFFMEPSKAGLQTGLSLGSPAFRVKKIDPIRKDAVHRVQEEY